MIYIYNGQDITGKQFEINGVKYPHSWCTTASIAAIESIGIIILDQIYPTLNSNQRYSGTFTDDFVSKTRTYTVVDYTPQPITDVPLWKLRIVLTAQGMMDSVTAAINELSEPNKTYANIGFEYANDVLIGSDIVQLIKASLSLSDSQVQDIFTAAAAISV